MTITRPAAFAARKVGPDHVDNVRRIDVDDAWLADELQSEIDGDRGKVVLNSRCRSPPE